jgi:hypothetical protein
MQPKNTPLTDKQFDFKEMKTSLFSVGNGVIETTATNTKVINSVVRTAIKIELSPCSDGYNSSFTDNELNLDKEK